MTGKPGTDQTLTAQEGKQTTWCFCIERHCPIADCDMCGLPDDGDALEILFPLDVRWDFAWHDLWTDGDVHLQRMHGQLMIRFRDRVRRQGAWAFPREFARLYCRHLGPLLGAPRFGCAA